MPFNADVKSTARSTGLEDAGILGGIWVLGAIVSGIWLWIDQTEPGWDQGAHLAAAMSHWRLFQTPNIFSPTWWTALWELSPNYRGPWVYLLTVPFLQVFGQGADQAVLVNEGFAALLIVTVYGLGRRLFDRATGLWSAGFCALSPALAFVRVDYLLDYGITAVVVGAFTVLTFWWTEANPKRTWGWSLGFGVVLGFATLAKPTNLLFLLFPVGWLLHRWVCQRQWMSGLQLLLSGGIAVFIPAGWIQQNWLTIISSMLNSNAVGRAEGDPSITTLAGWLYYLLRVPDLISWPLLVGAIAAGVVGIMNFRQHSFHAKPIDPRWSWLGSYVIGFYGLCTLATNKDLRFILPITPILIVIAVRLMLTLPSRWGRIIRWATVTMAGILLVYALFPLPGSQYLSDRHTATSSPVWPVREVVNTVYAANPYQVSTLGMLVDTPQIHAFNVDFYGTLAQFQVLGRQLGLGREFIQQDAQSLDWYLAKTGDQGSWKDHPVITPLRQQVESNPELSVFQQWRLPDGSDLRLYRRRHPAVTVLPVQSSPAATSPTQPAIQAQATPSPIQILRVETPNQATPGLATPVGYTIQGQWDALAKGLLILTWQQVGGSAYWVQDHAIGLNQLPTSVPLPTEQAIAQEQLATIPPRSLPLGTYQLHAWYQNTQTQTTVPLTVPLTQIRLVNAPTPPAFRTTLIPVDRVSRLRQLAQYLPLGQLDAVFKQVGPLNQYGSVKPYLESAAQAAHYRLAQNPQDLETVYTLALVSVLQRNAKTAIASLQQATQLDAQNPYAWADLAFVYLYNGQPQQADEALARVVALKPQLKELKTLQLVTAVMKGHWIEAVQILNKRS